MKTEKIPLTRPFFDSTEIKMVTRCLKSGWVTQGPMVSEFERRFAVLHDVKYALATTSCTSALHLSAIALGLKPGDEIIVPAYTWVTSANCVEYTGAKVIFADVNIDTFNVDPESVERAVTSKTKAVIVVHLFGLSADMDSIMAIARRHNLKVIEDAACAVGGCYAGRPVGGIGDVGCFSFHPRKIITTGEGGMAVTNSPQIAGMITSLRNHGTIGSEPGPGTMPKPYTMSPIINLGYNFRLSDIQGAVGLAQLSKLDFFLKTRRSWAKRYDLSLGSIEELVTPSIPERCSHTYQAYVVRLRKGGKKKRDRIMDFLVGRGIWTRPGTHAVHRLELYRDKYGLKPEEFPNAVRGEDETIALPLYQSMDEKDFKCVVRTIKDALSHVK